MVFKSIKQLEKEIEKMKKNHEGILNESDVCGNCDASGMCDLHRGNVDESLTKNDVLYAQLSQTKAIYEMIEKGIEPLEDWIGKLDNEHAGCSDYQEKRDIAQAELSLINKILLEIKGRNMKASSPGEEK